ncbi:MAG: tautomerase family protein [Acidimicrobiia bacterium]
MPFVDIRVVKDAFTHDEKQEMVARVSDAMIGIEGEGLRQSTHVVITETPDGEWAIGGKPMTADSVKQMRSSS